MPTQSEKQLISKHGKDEYGHKWSVDNHYSYYHCGQSCPCCRAKVQKETGEFQFGACQTCLNH